MINYPHPWVQFTKENKENYFLGELSWELEPFTEHILHKRAFRILAWVKGYDHFLIEDKNNQELFYVNLNWNKSGTRTPPESKQFIDIDIAINYIKKIKT